jgi:hypothetical protein
MCAVLKRSGGGVKFHNVKAWHRQRQLHIMIAAFVPIGEILQVKWDVSGLQVAAAAQFVRYVLGNVFPTSVQQY